LSFIFDKNAFVEMNGMDETLFGWGKEDVEFFERMTGKNISPQKIDLKGIHLWHSQTDSPIMTENKEMAILTCHFNWCKYRRPATNLLKFINRMREYEVPLYGVELSLTGVFETEGMPNWTHINVKKENICFQKEACINLLEKIVPEHFKKLAWIDADLDFKNISWYSDTIAALNKYKVVQMYSECHYTDENGDIEKVVPAIMKDGKPTSIRVFSDSSPGYAWAARRDLWKYGGLYPYAFVGGGDVAFSLAILNLEITDKLKENIGISNINENCKKFNSWISGVSSYVSRSVGCINDKIIHSWHGSLENRAYNTRYEIYKNVCIDSDVVISEDGILELPTVSENVKDKIFNYFKNRLEDGRNKTIPSNNKIVVYTCIIGDYDTLKDISGEKNGIDYICFTDKKITSDVWQIREIPKILSLLNFDKFPEPSPPRENADFDGIFRKSVGIIII
jgi:hypothetical protein